MSQLRLARVAELPSVPQVTTGTRTPLSLGCFVTQLELGDQRLQWGVRWVSHLFPRHPLSLARSDSVPVGLHSRPAPFSLKDTVTLGLTLASPDHHRTCSRIEKQHQMFPRQCWLGRPVPPLCQLPATAAGAGDSFSDGEGACQRAPACQSRRHTC